MFNTASIAKMMHLQQLCYGTAPAGQEGSAGLFSQSFKPTKATNIRMSLDTYQLDDFLKGVEKRAFRMAHIATSNVDDALDIVQDAMLILASKYAQRNQEEWAPLFHRILQNKIRDWYRRQKVRNIFQHWFSSDKEDDDEDPIQMLPDETIHDPVRKISSEADIQNLEQQLSRLPLRQQQTFLLRAWEGLDVKQTAEVMGISTGSVKTHYSRAMETLRNNMSEAGYE